MVERISLEDKSFFGGYFNHIQRYIFAQPFCLNRSVIDAGCGTGYGTWLLAIHSTGSIVGVDVSDEALAEASRLYRCDNLRFVKGDVERLTEIPDLLGPFDVVVNLENLEHLNSPIRFLEQARKILTEEGTLVVSTPNGEITERDEHGNIKNPFHVREFAEDELRDMLRQVFGSVELFGQWKTPERIARLEFETRLFETLCELYYSPGARLWRKFRGVLGMKCARPPEFTGAGVSFSREFTIEPIASRPFPWPPDVILAVLPSTASMTLKGTKKDSLQARNRHKDCPSLSLPPVSEPARPIMVAPSAHMDITLPVSFF
ncbi:MAG: class I SAM-dependent methyltransferase [Isosphaeraceae bacterium]